MKTNNEGKPMRKKVSFESKAELAKALIDGRVFYTEIDNKVYYDENKAYPFCFNNGELNNWHGIYRNLYEEVQWFNAIPEKGVLCWVWDDERGPIEDDYPVIVNMRRDDADRLFQDIMGTTWGNAEPLTREEALALVWGGEDE